jgi:hypothetical protein
VPACAARAPIGPPVDHVAQHHHIAAAGRAARRIILPHLFHQQAQQIGPAMHIANGIDTFARLGRGL